MRKCIICEHRPANGGAYCAQCTSQLEAQRKAKKKPQPRYFLHYRGYVVGLFPNGNGKLRAELLRRSLKYLPKYKTINLDVYCEGYTREQVKRFKACVLQLAHA